MALISEEWREQNAQLHSKRDSFGSAAGRKYAQTVRELLEKHGGVTVLDYGCGKASLSEHLGKAMRVRNYDPAIPAYAADPEPADVVVCADVLEHVEPECLDDVLAHLQRLTLKVALIVVACRLANKCVPDGRNAHISVHKPEWWQETLERWFRLEVLKSNDPQEFICLAFRK